MAAQHWARVPQAVLFGVPWSFLTLDGLAHLVLPSINLALFNLSLIIRLTRAGVREALPSEYVRFARAKGLRPARIVGVHVMKNIMIPVLTVLGLEFATTIAFSVVTESIFAWPGMGKLIIDSINVLDRPIIVAYLMLIVSAVRRGQPGGGFGLCRARPAGAVGATGMSASQAREESPFRRLAGDFLQSRMAAAGPGGDVPDPALRRDRAADLAAEPV